MLCCSSQGPANLRVPAFVRLVTTSEVLFLPLKQHHKHTMGEFGGILLPAILVVIDVVVVLDLVLVLVPIVCVFRFLAFVDVVVAVVGVVVCC